YANNTTGALIFNNSITSSNGDVSGKGAGIFTDHSSLNITNNIIKYGEHGLLEESHSSSIFSNNFIWDVVKHGVVVRGGSTTTITNNTFYNTCNADAIHLNNSYPSIGKNAYVGNYGVVNIEDDKHKQDGATGRSQYNPIDDAPPIVAPVIIGFDPVNKIFDLPGLSGKGYSFDAGKTARDTYDRMQSVTYSNPAGSYYTPPEYNNPLLTSDFGKSTFSLFGGLGQDGALQNIFASGKGSSKEDALDMGAVLKSLLKGRGEGSDSNSPLTTVQIARMVDQAFNQSAIAVPVYAKRAQAGEDAAVLKLSNILNNPTDMQKMIIDAVTAVMAQAEDTASDQVKKAADGFYRAAANAMLTQALPDILRDGDVANIKSLFSDLSNTKNRILAEYYETTKPYYDKTIKCLEKNMSFLQLNNILAKNMLESELENLPRSEIDRIIQKIKRLDKKAFETDYILQEEAKYRKAYIDPSKDALKDSFTGLLDDFTKKINIALDEARNRK
ncbi:MAG: hypothetical protein NTV07_00750, partial [Candidatus Omnitrophica bacterium]|nr:hypothetical protein [Candidatus Omnitrophota bacterium]